MRLHHGRKEDTGECRDMHCPGIGRRLKVDRADRAKPRPRYSPRSLLPSCHRCQGDALSARLCCRRYLEEKGRKREGRPMGLKYPHVHFSHAVARVDAGKTRGRRRRGGLETGLEWKGVDCRETPTSSSMPSRRRRPPAIPRPLRNLSLGCLGTIDYHLSYYYLQLQRKRDLVGNTSSRKPLPRKIFLPHLGINLRDVITPSLPSSFKVKFKFHTR